MTFRPLSDDEYYALSLLDQIAYDDAWQDRYAQEMKNTQQGPGPVPPPSLEYRRWQRKQRDANHVP